MLEEDCDVLVVDDQLGVRLLLSVLTKRAGYKVS